MHFILNPSAISLCSLLHRHSKQHRKMKLKMPKQRWSLNSMTIKQNASKDIHWVDLTSSKGVSEKNTWKEKVHPPFREHPQVSLKVRLVTRQFVLPRCCLQHSPVTQIFSNVQQLCLRDTASEGYSQHWLNSSNATHVLYSIYKEQPNSTSERAAGAHSSVPVEMWSHSTWTLDLQAQFRTSRSQARACREHIAFTHRGSFTRVLGSEGTFSAACLLTCSALLQWLGNLVVLDNLTALWGKKRQESLQISNEI